MAEAFSEYQIWREKLDEAHPLYEQLLAIEGNEAEITDRFYQEIEFGTAGLRGICGAGCNRMNEFTVGRATQGIANYILKSGKNVDSGVVIAYDCRYFSKEFSELAAEILAGNGIKAYFFPSLRPTPELSFAIRKLGTVSGINMTASHNPKEYNGYKVYWEDGAQISGEVSDGMLKEIKALSLFDNFKKKPLAEGLQDGSIVMLTEEMDEAYLEYVNSMALLEDSQLALDVPVVYTPLNGAGSIPMQKAAKMRGFKNFLLVSEQKDPDPDFTTVPYPNPENPKAFELAEKLGKEHKAEILIATDPDSDRMAIEIRDAQGEYIALNGNQTGALIIYYLAMTKSKLNLLPKKSAMIKSIVTGDFGRAICEDYGIEVFETLTGFKNICGKIPELEKNGYSYFFGYEESIGCAPDAAVRDKDGIAAGMILTEMAAYYYKQGKSLLEVLNNLYEKYGYYAENQVSIVLEGKDGQEKISQIMKNFREGKIDSMGDFAVVKVIDYLHGYEDIPPQNAMIFKMTDGSWFACRPSGTEPKIKFYYYTKKASEKEAKQTISKLTNAVADFVDKV